MASAGTFHRGGGLAELRGSRLQDYTAKNERVLERRLPTSDQRTVTLEHVYGAHYDMDEASFGHPVFHSQLGPQVEFGSTIGELFRHDGQVVNYMGKNPPHRTKRPRRRWMSFSVLTQICADHLMGEQPASEDKGRLSSNAQRLRLPCGRGPSHGVSQHRIGGRVLSIDSLVRWLIT